MLGSIDANRGDAQNGWDTDQFPIDNYDLLKAYLKDEEEDLYWSQGAMELIEKIGTQNWLPKDRIDNKYPTLFSSQGYILRRFRNWANPSNYSAPSR